MANLRTAIGAALVVAMSAHAALAQHLLYTYGATLGTGPDWTGLETRMAPNLTASGGVGGLYQLNGTYNIYVATASDGIGGCPVVFEVDTLLTEMSWWPDVLASRVHSVSSGPFDTMYNACPQGQGIEVTLNNDGTLTLVDLFSQCHS